MKINIEIELENGDYCNGCPCLLVFQHSGKVFCSNYSEEFVNVKTLENVIRPDICKEQNKEKTNEHR